MLTRLYSSQGEKEEKWLREDKDNGEWDMYQNKHVFCMCVYIYKN